MDLRPNLFFFWQIFNIQDFILHKTINGLRITHEQTNQPYKYIAHAKISTFFT